MAPTDLSQDNDEYYALMLVPPTGKGVRRWRVKRRVLRRFSWIGGFLLVFMLGVVIITAYQSRKIQRYHQLKQEQAYYKHSIQKYDNEIKAMSKKIKRLMEQQAEMKNMLKKKRSRSWRRQVRYQIKKLDQEHLAIQKNTPHDRLRVGFELDFLSEKLDKLTANTKSLSQRMQQNRARFAKTPSISPVYGAIRSDYGWRIHPKTGRRQFHKGVDIPSWIGAPVKSTADGVVEFSGWAGGYGWLIIVGHGYGYRTLYAHLSEIGVNKGQQVVKGQIIGKIGDTGMTTGPHIHYEIRRWRRSVVPKEYLDLDLFTAVRQLW